jgi:hypothetical protein
VIFTSLLAGTVAWIGYQASLTSELSVAKEKLPFNDLESLSNTDYRLTTYQAGSSYHALFIMASQGSIYQRLLQNNMNSDSFKQKTDGFESLHCWLIQKKLDSHLFKESWAQKSTNAR